MLPPLDSRGVQGSRSIKLFTKMPPTDIKCLFLKHEFNSQKLWNYLQTCPLGLGTFPGNATPPHCERCGRLHLWAEAVSGAQGSVSAPPGCGGAQSLSGQGLLGGLSESSQLLLTHPGAGAQALSLLSFWQHPSVLFLPVQKCPLHLGSH